MVYVFFLCCFSILGSEIVGRNSFSHLFPVVDGGVEGGSKMVVECWVLSGEMGVAVGVVETVESSLETYRGGCRDGRCCCVLLADDLGFLMPAILMIKAAFAEVSVMSPLVRLECHNFIISCYLWMLMYIICEFDTIQR